MDDIVIRQARPDDLNILLQFEQGVIAAERPYDITLKNDTINFYNFKEMMAADNVKLLVAEIKNEMVGSGYARIESGRLYLKHARHAYLGFMYVLPQHRGKGINKLIIETLKTWASSQGITELRLDVYEGNSPAIKAYEKNGFTKHMIEMRLGLNDY